MVPGLVQTAYIIGAGASSVCGIPTLRQFETAASDVLKTAKFQSRALRNLYDESLGEWTRVYRHLDVENHFVLLDMKHRIISNVGTVPPLSKVEWLREMAEGTSYGQESRSRHLFEYLIAKVILEKRKAATQSAMGDFVDSALAADNRSAFITTNWDDLAESALIGKELPIDIGCSHQDQGFLRSYGAHPVLKLHGSIGWWYCKRCDRIYVERDPQASIDRWETTEIPKCDWCKKRQLRPAFVPPVNQKLVDYGGLPRTFANVWNESRRQLMFCRRLVIIGYSFPQTDVEVGLMLNDAIRTNESLTSIEIVTSPKSKEHMEEYVERVKSYFNPRLGSYRIGPIAFPKLKLLVFEDGFEKWNPSIRVDDYQEIK